MEYRLTITIAGHGNEEAAERCLDAFLTCHSETGPVVSINPSAGTLSVTIALDATDPWAAGNLASRIFATGLKQSELAPTPIIDVAISAVQFDDDSRRSRELVPA